jgi:hypothetical protein
MRLTATRVTTSIVASAALAAGVLTIGVGSAAADQSAVGRPSPTAGHNPSPTAEAPAPGDVRVWESAHADAALPSRILPGDIRVWELRHSAPS